MRLKIRVFLIMLLLIPSFVSAKSLSLFFIDEDNLNSFNKKIGELKIKKNDKFLFVDVQNCQLILEKKMKSGNLVRRYSEKDNFFNLFYKNFDESKGYLGIKKSKQGVNHNLQLLNNEKNDFARVLKMTKNMIEIYKDSYKDINIIFFGDSYLHRAYRHDFKLGVPSDGFIYSAKSEFNTFDDIDAKGVKFEIFYDSEPKSSTQMYRFFKKLFKKKFSAELFSFNKNTTSGLTEPLLDENSTFFLDVVKIIKDKNIDDCGERDKITKNDLIDVAKVEIQIVNICRKNSILSFSHNGEKRQVNVDADGIASMTFKKIKGKNVIKYINLNGKWIEIYKDNALPKDNELIFDFDSATMTLHVIGNNPLRVDGSQLQLNYINTGAIYNLTVKDGKFEKKIHLEAGKNIFKWKDMLGKEHTKEITFYPKCTDRVDINKTVAQEYGIAPIKLENSCREDGSSVTFLYGGEEYKSIVLDGKAEINMILKYDINEIYYKNFNGNNKKIATITIRNFSDLIRFMIKYRDNVAIYEHIFETNITPTKPVFVVDYRDRSLDKDGYLHTYNTLSTKGKIWITERPLFADFYTKGFKKEYKQVYITRKSKQGKGQISFYVDYFSRHGTVYTSTVSKPPLCHNRSLGGVVVEYDLLINGSSQLGRKFLNPSKCKGGKPTNSDIELILIKEVDIK